MSKIEMLNMLAQLISQIEYNLAQDHPSDHTYSADLDDPGCCGVCGWYSLSDKDIRTAGKKALENLALMRDALIHGGPEEMEEVRSHLAHLFPDKETDSHLLHGFETLSIN